MSKPQIAPCFFWLLGWSQPSANFGFDSVWFRKRTDPSARLHIAMDQPPALDFTSNQLVACGGCVFPKNRSQMAYMSLHIMGFDPLPSIVHIIKHLIYLIGPFTHQPCRTRLSTDEKSCCQATVILTSEYLGPNPSPSRPPQRSKQTLKIKDRQTFEHGIFTL